MNSIFKLLLICILQVFVCNASIRKSSQAAFFIQHSLDKKVDITAKSYIQDGLFAQFDGIENAGYGIHNENAYFWKDLVGDRDATIAGDVYFIENAIHRDPTSSAKILIPNIPVKQGFTIEYCCVLFNIGDGNFRDFSLTISGKRFEINQNANGLCGPFYYNIKNSYVSRIQYRNVHTADIKTFSYGFDDKGIVHSLNDDGSYYDYTSNTPISNDYYGNAILSIGSWSQLFENANYYSIRIYSRTLTFEEIKHNYLIDKMRFRL